MLRLRRAYLINIILLSAVVIGLRCLLLLYRGEDGSSSAPVDGGLAAHVTTQDLVLVHDLHENRRLSVMLIGDHADILG